MIRHPEAEALRASAGALLAIGDDGLVSYANSEALRLLGWDHNLIGKPISAMVPPELREKHREAFSVFAMSRQVMSYPRVQPALGLDGRIRHVNIQVGAFTRPDGSLFLCSAMADPQAKAPSLQPLASRLEAAGYQPTGELGHG